MSYDRKSIVEKAKQDLARRLGVSLSEVEVISVEEKDFLDTSLGAPVEDEMSAQMITSGWQVKLKAGGEEYEYRADSYQLRLYKFQGENHICCIDECN